MADSGARVNVEKDIRKLVADILETEPNEIDGNARFVQDLGMDSMMALEILAGLEKKYRIVIPEESLAKFVNLNATIKIVEELLGKKA
ncbi:MAG: acyl carrier protein [Candidatus Omnitrophota bacterium]|jgi:acyl carrier protein